MNSVSKITIVGGGSFGTAMSNIAANNGYNTVLWMRSEERAKRCQVERENSDYVPGYRLHDNVTVSSDLAAHLPDTDILVVAVPSSSVRELCKHISGVLPESAVVVSATKGIEKGSFYRMSQVLVEELDCHHALVLSGPNFAKEIVADQYTGCVVASKDPAANQRVQKALSSPTFRIYTSDDPVGVELAGALKNIYAIIVGMAETLGCGPNTTAMIVTRGLAEMRRFAANRGANEMTFLGLAGVGDLVLTCGSDQSRNYRIGACLARGLSLNEAKQEIGQVAEGINTLEQVYDISSCENIYMPLAEGLYKVVFEGASLNDIVYSLMTAESQQDVVVNS